MYLFKGLKFHSRQNSNTAFFSQFAGIETVFRHVMVSNSDNMEAYFMRFFNDIFWRHIQAAAG
jgi:hypothetical protein